MKLVEYQGPTLNVGVVAALLLSTYSCAGHGDRALGKHPTRSQSCYRRFTLCQRSC